MLPKWSSGRACGAALTTQWTRSASLRSRALMDKMEKKKDAQKKPNDLQELCSSSTKLHQKCAKVVPKTTPNHRNDAGTISLEARGVQRLKKQTRTAPERRRNGAKKMPWPQRTTKEPEFTKKATFWDSCAQGLISTCFY